MKSWERQPVRPAIDLDCSQPSIFSCFSSIVEGGERRESVDIIFEILSTEVITISRVVEDSFFRTSRDTIVREVYTDLAAGRLGKYKQGHTLRTLILFSEAVCVLMFIVMILSSVEIIISLM